jgi:uncharacterized protein (DUF849 family)
MEKLIITCAPTGSLTIPTQTPYLPITPEEIADDAVRAAEAGAAVVHIHAREPKEGRPTSDLNIFRSIVTRIKEQSNVIIGTTTGGGPGMTAEERLAVIPALKPEIASFNMGPICNSARLLMDKLGDRGYKYSWEKPHLELLEGFIQVNTFTGLDIFLRTFEEHKTKSECECYDISHIYNVAYLFRRGQLKPPIWMQFVTGAIGSIGGSPEDIVYMKSTADRLLGAENYHWSLIGVGSAQYRTVTMAIIMGGNVRVGFEDNVYLEKGVLAKSNADVVAKIVRIAKELGREIATPDEVRKLLKLKGREKVNF